MYVRMIFLTLISLYTVRVVLYVLGTSDYGLYNVVGGIVGVFGFVSGTLINAAQRFFSYHLAKNDWKMVSRIYSINMIIYLVLIAIVIILSETIGLWFLFNKMKIDAARMDAAFCVYQLSVATFALGVISSPFQAILVSDENLKTYSLIAIAEGVLRLAVVYIISISNSDKLILYAWLLMFVKLLVYSFYILYARIHYKELKFHFVREINAYKEIFSFTSWNFVGAIASVGKSQGVNIVINLFFGTVVNAARGIAVQINSILTQFSQNFMKAIEPQIIKTYTRKDEQVFIKLLYFSSRVSFCLLFVAGLPLIKNMQYVLSLWLKEVPQYTAFFAALVIVDTIIGGITEPILTAIQATGKIKIYQIVVGGINLLNIPLSYIFLKIYNNPLVPFVVSIIVTLLMMNARIVLAYRQVGIVIREYLKRVIIPILIISAISVCFSYFVIPEAGSLLAFIRNIAISLAVTVPLLFFIGFNKQERRILINMLPRKGKNSDM